MQPLRIIIPGQYWDTQLYSGTFYLFGMNGTISAYNWHKFCTAWSLDASLKLPLECAFLRSDLLYGDDWTTVFQDEDVRDLLRRKFEALLKWAPQGLRLPSAESYQGFLRKQDSPFPFPHTDSVVYKNVMYVASHQGLHYAKCNKKQGNPVNRNSQRFWDCPALSVSASYGTLSVAGGSEGLFERRISEPDYIGYSGMELVEDRNCVSSNWLYFSVMASSHTSASFFVRYENKKGEYNEFPEREERHRMDTLVASELFGESGYSWGFKHRLCLARPGRLHILNYNPFKRGNDSLGDFDDLGIVELAPWKGEVISGAIAPFGIVIECEHAIVVVPSDDSEAITIPGEPVSWRIFPRSKYYQNQLHIIYPDRLEIWSFNHDYFVDQKKKKVGIRPELRAGY